MGLSPAAVIGLAAPLWQLAIARRKTRMSLQRFYSRRVAEGKSLVTPAEIKVR
jgi:hypothetical protein